MRKLILTGVMASTMCGNAWALDASDEVLETVPLGNGPCYVFIQSNSQRGFAQVWVQDVPIIGDAVAGQSRYLGRGPGSVESLAEYELTKVKLAACLSVPVTQITYLAQNGADSTFDTDDYLGFAFSLGQEAGGLTAGRYEYKVGSGSLLPANATPTANAGPDQTDVDSAAIVTLDGSASADTDGTVASYAWTQTSGTPVTLTNASTASSTFTAPTLTSNDRAEVLVFSLTITDNEGAISSADTVSITVLPPDNSYPVANAGPDQSVTSAATVTLDGSRSTDSDGSVASYAWTQTSGTPVTLTNASTASPTFTAPTLTSNDRAEVLVFSLTITDNEGAISSADTVSITVNPPSDTTPPDAPTIEEIQTEVATYMQARANLLIGAQPDLIGFLSGDVAGAFNANVTRGQGTFNFASPGDQPVWARFQGKWSNNGDNDNSYFFGAVGGHVNLSPNAIAGVTLQYDRLAQEDGNTVTEGDGYLFGPYFVAKLPEQHLYFEGRYLFGKTNNSVSVDGAPAQDFETDRSLLSLKVAGQLAYGDLTLSPSLTATRLEDTQAAFTDNFGRAVAEQSITTTDVALGLDFAKPIDVSNGSLILTGGIAGIWSDTDGTGFADTITPNFGGSRGRVHLGTTYILDSGIVLSAGVSYDGIGADDFETFGVNLGIDMKF